MNHLLLSILSERPDFILSAEDKKILEFFVEYLDHNSLWLLGYHPSDDPIFTFTNEAQRFRFTLSEIKKYYHEMKSGVPMNWETIPYSYISDEQ